MNNKKKLLIISLLADSLLLILCIMNIVAIVDKSNIPAKINSDCKILDSKSNILKTGDEIHKINNLKIRNEQELHYILNFVKIGSTVTLDVRRNKETFKANIKTLAYYDFNYVLVISVVSLLFLFPAIYIYLTNYEVKFTAILHWTFVSAALMIMLTDGSFLTYNHNINVLLQAISIFSFLSTPIFALISTFYFPRVKWKNNKYISIPLLLIVIIISIILSYLYNKISFENISSLSLFIDLKVNIVERIFVPFTIATIASFIHSFYYFKDEIDQRRLLWLTAGLLLGAFCYSFMYILPRIYLKHTLINETWIILMLSFTPLSYFMAIVSYRILDIKLLINRTIVYSAILVSIIGIFSMIYLVIIPEVMGVSSVEQDKFMPVYFISVITSLVLALLFQPAKNAVQNTIDKNFFTLKYNFAKVHNVFISSMSNVVSEEDVINLLQNTLNQAIPVSGLAFAIFEENATKLHIAYNDNINININIISMLLEYYSINKDNDIIADPKWVEEGVLFINNKNLLDKLNIKIIIPYINEKNEPVCLLMIPEKKSMYKFNHEDVTLIKSLLFNAGIEIDKINLQKELIYKSQEKKKLEEINVLKTSFVSGVSHELKTPITSIRLFAEILQVKKDLTNEKRSDYLEIIKGECDRLNRLINNVLDFAKIEKGAKTYSLRKIDLGTVLRQSIKLMKYQISIHKFKFDLDIPEGEYPLIADEDAVKEVIINLISNAIKYSLYEKYLSVKLYNEKGYYVLDVADRGIGISDQDLNKIFEPFYRSKNDKTLNAGGAGIGLALVNEIMNAHKGVIKVKSTEGKGSIFTLMFPKEIENEISAYN